MELRDDAESFQHSSPLISTFLYIFQIYCFGEFKIGNLENKFFERHSSYSIKYILHPTCSPQIKKK